MLKKLYELKKLHEKKGKKGFSMIELIIVIAIMAILVALIGTQLIPYLEKSREKRDLTTLDTCKTALESVMADYEFDVKGQNYTGAQNLSTVLGDIDTNASNGFKVYAGIATDAEPFKSAKADSDTPVSDVKVTFNSDGVITEVAVGDLNLINQSAS